MDFQGLMYGCLEMEKAVLKILLKIPDSFVGKLNFPASVKEVPASCSVPGAGDTNSQYFVFSSAMS